MPLHVAGGAGVLLRLQGTGGTCDHTPGAASETVACSSDERLKTDISDASPVLDELARLRIRQYKIRFTGEEGVGVIAQEVEKTAPELVKEGKDGYLMVSQIPHWKLVKAIQELERTTKEQQAEIETLKEQLRRLEDVRIKWPSARYQRPR